jgi:hypothetical protein
MMKKTVLLTLIAGTSSLLSAGSVAPEKFRTLYETITTSTNTIESLLFNTKTGIIAHNKQNKPTKEKLEAHGQAFDEAIANLEQALYKFLDLLATTDPSKNFQQGWSFDLPEYPTLEEQKTLQQESGNLMNAFQSIINKEQFVSHFFNLWLTEDYEDVVISLFYTIGQDLVARSIDDLNHAYDFYLDRLAEQYSIKK